VWNGARAVLGAVLALMVILPARPAVASPHAPCRAVHGPRFCEAHEQRVAIRKVRAQLRIEARRTHVAFREPRHHLGWKLRRLHDSNDWHRRLLAHYRSLPDWIPSDPRAAICVVFVPCGGALSVASCETGGTFSIYASNGQYQGLFQMGSSERAKYAHGRYETAYDQAMAAFRYSQSGRNWGPWQCQPGGGLAW
jgi:hypothetical protein